jgi:hypothetical protein
MSGLKSGLLKTWKRQAGIAAAAVGGAFMLACSPERSTQMELSQDQLIEYTKLMGGLSTVRRDYVDLIESPSECFSGKGIMKLPSGIEVYVGEIQDGQPHGMGVSYHGLYANVVRQGAWSQGKFTGFVNEKPALVPGLDQ